MLKTLYLMKSDDYLKIGITDNLDKRLKQYRTHNPNIPAQGVSI